MRAYRFAAILLGLMPILGGEASPGHDLTFEQRVKAQRLIERVRYSHQVGATRPFDEAYPRALLEIKVRRYLAQSHALESVWGSPLTAEDLQKET